MEGAAIASFAGTFGYLPNSTSDWNIVAALAYDILGADEAVVEEEVVEEEATEEEVVEEEAVEEVVEEVVDQVELTDAQVAIGVFGKLTGALPSSSADWTAVDHMLDGYTPDERDLAMEGAAIGVFAGAFGYLPNSASDWNIIAALAYDILGAEEAVEEEATEEEVVEEEAAEEEVVEELSPEELAIGTFGKLAGALPSSDADWLAVDYILNGYTPAERDLSLEEAAIAMFGGVYGAVPSTDSDWNIIAAIAYSGAFDLDVEEAEVVVEEVGTVTIDETGTGWLRVRSTPEITDDNEVGQVTVGESYTYVETSEDGAWYKVVYDDAASEGWVFADYATLNE